MNTHMEQRRYISTQIIHTSNCTIIRYNAKQSVVNLLHALAFVGHIQGRTEQTRIYEGHLESKERSRIQPAQLFQCS
jgi:hypothetical protein